MKKFLKRQLGKLLGYEAELEEARMTLVAVSVAASCNTRQSAEQRLKEDSPYWHPAVADVHAAVDREIDLREANRSLLLEVQEIRSKFGFSVSTRDNLRNALNRKTAECVELQTELNRITKPGVFVEVESADQSPIMKELFEARARIADMLMGDDGQAWKEAEKYMARSSVTDVVKVSTKNCPKCDSAMIAMHSEDKKMCSNGACGHEINWDLEDGQQYLYKRDVEPFVEDRSNVKEVIEE